MSYGVIQKVYAGIDPGKNGGIVLVDENYNIIEKHIMPIIVDQLNVSKFREIFNNWTKKYNLITALEDVHSISMSSAKANFNFGRILGATEASISLSGVSMIKVQPKTWQKIAHQGITKGDAKEMSLAAATRLAPNENWVMNDNPRAFKPHDGVIDAYLIARYCVHFHTVK